ncbi:MAG: hypothetical protein IJN02_07455 [Bacteroidales bacterium]|nr:hypothetical protein [Bacteroidales bacterium]
MVKAESKAECYYNDVCNCILEKDNNRVICAEDLPLSAKLMVSIRSGRLKCRRYIKDDAEEYCVLKRCGARATIHKRSLGSRNIYELVITDRRGQIYAKQTESQNEGVYSLKELYECALNVALGKEKIYRKLIGKL